MIRQIKRWRRSRGFSLVELMVVVAIIGILASLALPKFKKFTAAAKQSEAKNSLSHIFTLEVGYQGLNSKYGTLSDIGWDTPEGNALYGYTDVGTPSATTFGAKALEKSTAMCGTADEWTIDQTNVLTAVKDCSK